MDQDGNGVLEEGEISGGARHYHDENQDGNLTRAEFLEGYVTHARKDREKERPYCLEVNSQPGTVGYNTIIKGNILEDVLKTYMNRDNWK